MLVKALRPLAVLAGVLIVVWLVWEIGIATLVHELGKLSWRLPLILLPQIVTNLFKTEAWRLAFPRRRPGFGLLFPVRLALSEGLGVTAISIGIPAAEGPPSASICALVNTPDRIWMLLTHHSRRSSGFGRSPSANRIAVGNSARRALSSPWFAVQSSWKIPSTYLVTTGGVAASS